MPGKVADASVLGALIFQEPRSQEAMALLSHGPIYAPTLLSYELASIARKKILKQPNDRLKIFGALRIGLAMDITWVEADAAALAELSLDLKVTAYDAAYLWVARRLGAQLATFDERLKSAAA